MLRVGRTHLVIPVCHATHSPEEGAQHLGDPCLVVEGNNEAHSLSDVLWGAGRREGQVPFAYHEQVVPGAVGDDGLGTIHPEETLQVAYCAVLVDTLGLQARSVHVGNRILVSINRIGQGGFRERLNQAEDKDSELDDRVINLTGPDGVDDGDLIIHALGVMVVGQNTIDEATGGALDVGEPFAAHDQAATDPIRP